MSLQTITLSLPEKVVQQARQAAQASHRPFEEVIVATLAASLPNFDDVPAALQSELAEMSWLNDRELWQIARSMLKSPQETELQHLVEIQKERQLSDSEEKALDALRHEYGRITLCKARAYALLSLRGGQPLLATQ